VSEEKKVSDAVARLRQKAEAVRRTFATSEGKECLEILRREFAMSLDAKEEHAVLFKAGRCDAYNWIMQMINLTEEGR
jgi:hypothetical protein